MRKKRVVRLARSWLKRQNPCESFNSANGRFLYRRVCSRIGSTAHTGYSRCDPVDEVLEVRHTHTRCDACKQKLSAFGFRPPFDRLDQSP